MEIKLNLLYTAIIFISQIQIHIKTIKWITINPHWLSNPSLFQSNSLFKVEFFMGFNLFRMDKWILKFHLRCHLLL